MKIDWHKVIFNSGDVFLPEPIKNFLSIFIYKYPNTKNESNRVIEYAMINKIDNIIICAPTFHILRATLTILSSAIQKGVNINISSIIVKNSNWNRQCITHQGNTNDNYHTILEIELDRIYEYMKKGDILSFKVIWQYLDKFL